MFFSQEEAKPLLKGKIWIAFISGGFHLFSPVIWDPNSQFAPFFFLRSEAQWVARSWGDTRKDVIPYFLCPVTDDLS